MSNFNSDQRYLINFYPDEGISNEERDLGMREAARQLHSIHEYPYAGLPADAPPPADYVNKWEAKADGSLKFVCESYAHAVQIDTFLGIVECFNCEMEKFDGE